MIQSRVSHSTWWALGQSHSPIYITDVANLTKITRQTHETCFTLKPGFYLEHGATYYTIVWAYNGAARQQNISQISDGGMLKCTILSAFINPII